MQHVTIMFLVTNSQVLLAMKKRGFGVGKLNGAGGKVEPGETPAQAAVRECQEEIGVTVTEFDKVAEIEFDEHHENVHISLFSHVYLATKWEGEPVETEEMAPEWFPIDNPPLDRMWVDDHLWLPQVLAGIKLKAFFKIDSDSKTIVEYTVTIVDKL